MRRTSHDPGIFRSFADAQDDTSAQDDTAGKTAKLETYKLELLRWNERINLIGPEAVANLDDHIAEAVAAAGILKPQGDVLDFGSGGGLPAVPMAIISPEARFHLVESDKKKWAFLKHIVRACELNAVV